MNKQAVIRALQQAHDWVKQRREGRSTAGEPWLAENIMVGCVQVINQTGQSKRHRELRESTACPTTDGLCGVREAARSQPQAVMPSENDVTKG